MNKLLYEPGKWHACTEADWPDCEAGVNCYAYALNEPAYHWAVPGLGFAQTRTRHFYDSFNKHFEGVSPAAFREQLASGAVRDGLVTVEEPVDREGYYLAALFFPDKVGDFDFHWYRKDDTGNWSHKNGWQAPRNTDAAGNAIRDLRDIADPAYPIFGGFYLVPRSGVTLHRTFPLLGERSE